MPVSFSEFEKPSLANWIDKADLDLKGKMLADEMTYQVEPGLQVPVFLDSTPENPSFLTARSKVGVEIRNLQNDIVLHALELGAQALLLRWKDDTPIAPFFTGVIIEIIDLTIDDRQCSSQTSSALKYFMASNGYGAVTFLSDGVNELLASDSFQDRIRTIKSRTQDNILLELKSDFLAQIAELRAIRIITKAQPIKILATLDSQLAASSDRQSLIAVNYAFMAAYLGSANAVFGYPDGGDESMSRLSLNIQHILQLESGINDVSDPLAGSYIVEKLTQALVAVGS